jgi:hypothetical protein
VLETFAFAHRAARLMLVLAMLAPAAATVRAQSAITNSGGAGMIGSPGAGALGGDGAGMIGGPAAHAGTRGTGTVTLPDNQPHNPAPSPPVGAGYGTPGNVGNTGNASNSGVGAGVQSDITTGIPTSPNMR